MDSTPGKWFFKLDELSQADNDRVGKKCANLGELQNLGLRTPRGFAVSVDGCQRFMDQSGAGREVRKLVESHASGNQDVGWHMGLSKAIRSCIEARGLAEDMQEELAGYYQNLCDELGRPQAPVVVRSSGAVSMPGQMETYLNVCGLDQVARRLVQVWSSAFTSQALAFRRENDMPLDSASIGVAVLELIPARAAGVALTVLPATGDESKVVVEGNWGLGESVVGGEVIPDQFVMDKASGRIMQRLSRKTKMVVAQESGTVWAPVPQEKQNEPCLNASEIAEIVSLALEVEAYFQKPQDLEWVIAQGRPFPESLYWVQARPAKVARAHTSEPRYLADLMSRMFSM